MVSKEIELLLEAGNIVAIKAFKGARGRKASYILFSDGETIMELQEQDYYTYHDCSSSARIINVYKDKETWERRMNIESNKNWVDAETLS